MARFEVGDTVRTKANPDRAGMVRRVFDAEGDPQYEVFFSANERPTFPEHSLLAEDEAGPTDDPVELLKRWQLGEADEFRSFMTLAKMVTPLASNVYSYLASRTEKLEYQFKPVLKLLDSPYSRILIADEVGLGKTIEAGIILTELHARQSLVRVLVTCPSALTDKWRSELRERFEWDFTPVDGSGLRDALAGSSGAPEMPVRLLASMELMRREENLAALQEHAPRFDLVIVDEAHHMRNQGTMTNQLGEMLSGYADAMIFLTATPLNLGSEDFYELLSLLVPEEFHQFADFEDQIEPNRYVNAALRSVRKARPDYAEALKELREVEATAQGGRFGRDPRYRQTVGALETAAANESEDRAISVRLQRDLLELNTLSHVFTRTKKREVSELFPLRRAHWIHVRFSAEEREFYDAVTEWVGRASQRYGIGVGVFVTIMFQRQVASCIPALGEKLEDSVLNSSIDYDRDEVVEALAPDQLLEAESFLEGDAHLELVEEERDLLARLRQAWRATRGHDSKFDAFAEELTRLMEGGAAKVIVFSFFRKTIEYLERRLSELEIAGHPLRVIKLYGPVPPSDRSDCVKAFREEQGPVVLLSSEVGSEGLDFQFCSSMFNYDLTWNPMRVEQRIGRLDRFGQQADSIEIINLVAEDTIEDRIFARLYERIGIFERSIGDLEAILGTELRDLQRAIAAGSLTREEEEERAKLVADAILRRQQEHDEFDEQSRKFLGHDEVFRERFNDIEEGQRYISADELRNFLERFFIRCFPKVKLRRADRSDVYELTGGDDPEFRRFLTDWFTRESQASQLDWRLINRLSSGQRLPLTFSASAASLDHTIEFISIHHPLVRAAVGGEQEREHVPTGRLRLPADGAAPGPRIFFIFRLNVGGMKRRLEFVPVVIDATGTPDRELSDAFFARLGSVEQSDLELSGLLTDEAVEAAATVARATIAREVAMREDDARRTNDAAVDAQTESLRLGYERRRDRLQRQLAEAQDPRIVRLYRGELANREVAFERKLAELENKRGVEVSSELVAAGVLDVA